MPLALIACRDRQPVGGNGDLLRRTRNRHHLVTSIERLAHHVVSSPPRRPDYRDLHLTVLLIRFISLVI
jgi:hypothetical protein